MARLTENVMEWVTGAESVTCTFSQQKYINRIRRMAEKHPKQCVITAENPDGSIVAHIPTKAIHLTIYDPKNT